MSSNSKKRERVAILSKVSNPQIPFLFEVIKVENKQLQNIDYHNDRLNRSLFKTFRIKEPIKLENFIKIPSDLSNQIYKCRVIYSNKIEKIEFEPYHHRNINSLKIVTQNTVEYSIKYFDRKIINELFKQRENCDDILIVKNGFITDISYANIVFWDGYKWITPSTPLLPGTKRQKLIDEGRIFEKEIMVDDLLSFEKARIINAMIDLEESNNILIKNILN